MTADVEKKKKNARRGEILKNTGSTQYRLCRNNVASPIFSVFLSSGGIL